MSATFSNSFAGAATWTLQTQGDYFRLVSSPTAVDLIFYRQNQQVATANGMDTGFYIQPVGGFDRVDVISNVAQTVKIMILTGDGGYDRFNVDITSALANLAIAQAVTVNDPAPVSVGVAATALLAAASGRKGARFTNAGTVDVYLGGVSVTVANAAIKISPGQTWLENEAAPAAWYGISGTAAQSIKIQELI